MLVKAGGFAAMAACLLMLAQATRAACTLSPADLDGIATQLTGSNLKTASKAMATLAGAAHRSGGDACVSATLSALLILKSHDTPAPLRAQAQQLVAEFAQSGKVAPALFPGLLEASGSADL